MAVEMHGLTRRPAFQTRDHIGSRITVTITNAAHSSDIFDVETASFQTITKQVRAGLVTLAGWVYGGDAYEILG